MRNTTLEAIQASLGQLRQAVLAGAGDKAVALVRSQMLHGYGRPVYHSGALLRDVRWVQDGPTAIRLVNTLPYAAAVHNGRGRAQARPYMTDALLNGRAEVREAAAAALRRLL